MVRAALAMFINAELPCTYIRSNLPWSITGCFWPQVCIALEAVLQISYAKLAPSWALIQENLDLIQEIETKVVGGHSFKGGCFFTRLQYLTMWKCITWRAQSLPLPPSGLLLYLSDGMFPLLKSFYADFFNPTGGDSDRHRWMRVSSNILTALLVSFFYCSCMTSCLWERVKPD